MLRGLGKLYFVQWLGVKEHGVWWGWGLCMGGFQNKELPVRRLRDESLASSFEGWGLGED